MEKKKGLKAWHIVLIIIAIIIIPYALIFGVVFGFAYFDEKASTPSFEINDKGNIDISKMKLDINSNVETLTDMTNQCYSLVIKIENKDTKKYPALQLQYEFTDNEGYVVGKESGYLDDIEPGKKYKMLVSYCGPSFDKIEKYELINVYTNNYMN